MAVRRTPFVLFLFIVVLFLGLQVFLVSWALLEALFRQENELIRNAAVSRPLSNAALIKRQKKNTKKKPNRLVWFLHFHKAAGTSFTDLAWSNHERVRHSDYYKEASDDEHGHLELDSERQLRWELVWPQRPSPTACKFPQASTRIKDQQSHILEREFKLLRQHNITFTSTEHWFPPHSTSLQKQAITFVVLLREPMERLVSSYHFHKGGANRCPSPKQKSCSFGDWWPAESNMHVKMLNGIPFGPLKVGKLCARKMFNVPTTAADFENALESLQRFHVVLTLQSFTERPEQVACVLQKTLGWNVTKLGKQNVNRKRRKRNLVIQDDELEKARTDNVWDLQLYKRARALEQDLFEKLGCV